MAGPLGAGRGRARPVSRHARFLERERDEGYSGVRAMRRTHFSKRQRVRALEGTAPARASRLHKRRSGASRSQSWPRRRAAMTSATRAAWCCAQKRPVSASVRVLERRRSRALEHCTGARLRRSGLGIMDVASKRMLLYGPSDRRRPSVERPSAACRPALCRERGAGRE